MPLSAMTGELGSAASETPQDPAAPGAANPLHDAGPLRSLLVL